MRLPVVAERGAGGVAVADHGVILVSVNVSHDMQNTGTPHSVFIPSRTLVEPQEGQVGMGTR
jgi:hypothetical protein